MRPLAAKGLLRAWRVSTVPTRCLVSPRVCVVGSGPAGFYTTHQLIKGHTSLTVDIIDQMPVPFGLVRYGIAPDHPEVKNVTNTFSSVAENPRVNFIGNVCVGKDITFAELQDAYHVIVLSYGASEDQKLGMPGEDLPNVLAARRFVGWYNGLPEDNDLEVDLQTDTATVIGHGNVALDVARILLTPVDILKKTDITARALHALSGSRVKRVILIGRRGPLQAAFTIKELREMTKLPGCGATLHKSDFEGIEPAIKELPRPRKRLTELLLKTLQQQPPKACQKWWELKFFRSPLEIQSKDGKVHAIQLGINQLQDDKAVPTGDTELQECGLVLRSIGYRSTNLPGDPLPFDDKNGVISNSKGRVTGIPGVYCSGWVSRGPVGVILATMADGFDVGKTILKDLEAGKVSIEKEKSGVVPVMQQRGVQAVSFSDWKKIEKAELELGKSSGKLAEKIIHVNEMLRIARET